MVTLLDTPFTACWHRIDRAEAHRKAAAEVWNNFINDDPYDSALEYHGEGQFTILLIQNYPVPPEMAVFIGEWLYNLRCALDYAVYAAAIFASGKNPPPLAGQLQFPVYFEESLYRNNEYRLKSIPDHQRLLIETMQPYKRDSDASALGWLHRLARIDRHRCLTVMGAYIAEASPLVHAPPGCEVLFEPGERVIVNREADIAHFTVIPWQEDWEIQANPNVGIDPEIAEWAGSPFWRKIAYNERLSFVRLMVEGMVAALEYDCTGRSRRAALLKQSFRVECDARRRQPEL